MGTTCSINVKEKLYIAFAELLKKKTLRRPRRRWEKPSEGNVNK